MKAVILCAGKGTRLKELTSKVPKPLVEVAGTPILLHNLKQLIGIVDEIILVVGYKSDLIKERIGNDFHGIKISYVNQEIQNGSGGALLLAKDFLNDKFIVLNGDDFYSKKDLINISKKDLAILAKEVENPSLFGVLKIENNFLIDIAEKPKEFISNLISTGVYVLDNSIFDYEIKESIRGEIELTDFARQLAKEKDIYISKVIGYWFPVNTIEQFNIANVEMKKRIEKCAE